MFRLRSHEDYSMSEEQSKAGWLSHPTVWEDVDLFPMGKKEGTKDGENLHTIHILRNDVFIRGLIVLALGIASAL